MNSLPGSGHAAVSRFRTEGLHDFQGTEGMTDATHITTALDANTEATLALAFEQRTANLLTWALANDREPSQEQADELCDRLGLNGDTK